jgi:shikimate dehydrogenase
MTTNNPQSLIPNTRLPITGTTRLTGVIGWPVAHSLSPAMHNAAFAALGLNYAYVPLPVPPERLEAAVRGLAALGFVGANVTVPHKSAVLPFLDELTPIAAAIDAVNTIVVRPDGTLLGDNTDAAGFLADLRAHGVLTPRPPLLTTTTRSSGEGENAITPPSPETAVPFQEPQRGASRRGGRGGEVILLGAGGAARAVAYALAEAGATVAVVNRTLERAQALCERIRRSLPATQITAHPFPAALPALAPAADPSTSSGPALIVNATSLGLHPDDPLPWDATVPFRPGQVVYDLIYSRQTPLLVLAQRGGARTINGLGMLVHQGAESFKLWTGQAAPIDVMFAVLCGK